MTETIRPFAVSPHVGGLRILNSVIRPTGLRLVPEWRFEWWNGLPRFQLHDCEFECFCHSYNCGFPPCRMTERALELAVADRWLTRTSRETVIEIGAVTPYYWPHRVPAVVDPYDPHSLVTTRCSMFDLDFSGRSVLSISTLEHIGAGDYGPATDGESSVTALEKVVREARRFLVTVPLGVNPALDAWLSAASPAQREFRVGFLVRSETGNDWRQVAEAGNAVRPYVSAIRSQNAWANAVAILDRGGL